MKVELLAVVILAVTVALSETRDIPKLKSDTYEMFKKYECLLCKEVLLNSVKLVGTELKLNEAGVIELCDKTFGKFIKEAGTVICHIFLQHELDQMLKDVTPESEESFVNSVCHKLRFCEQ